MPTFANFENFCRSVARITTALLLINAVLILWAAIEMKPVDWSYVYRTGYTAELNPRALGNLTHEEMRGMQTAGFSVFECGYQGE